MVTGTMANLISRKEFLKSLGLGAAALLCPLTGLGFAGNEDEIEKDISGRIFKGDAQWKTRLSMPVKSNAGIVAEKINARRSRRG